jgi:feruloyl-CoA synthase
MLPSLGENPLAKLTELLKDRIAEFNRTAGGSSRRIDRFTIMTDPPSIDAGEITDKGYVNQRATLEHRKALVDGLYANPPGAGVVSL